MTTPPDGALAVGTTQHAIMPELSSSALLGLLRLSSTALPVGAYAYSQGLEWAIGQGWINHAAELGDWLEGLLDHQLACWDVPLLARLYDALHHGEAAALQHWNGWWLAGRNTAELRAEDLQMGNALLQLLDVEKLPVTMPAQATWGSTFAAAALSHDIPLPQMILGYLWSWSEQQVLAATRLMPLGQKTAQHLLVQLQGTMLAAAEQGLALPDEGLGGSSPGWTLACMLHETQYSRLFRS